MINCSLRKKIKKLEKRIERLEQGKKPYMVPSEKMNPYDLSEIARLFIGNRKNKES